MKYFFRLFAITIILFVASNSWALVGVGIHGGMDMTTIEEKVYEFSLPGDPAGWSTSTLTREESEQPYNIGVDLAITAFPIIDVMVSVDFALARYRVTFDPPDVSGQPSVSKVMGYSRVGGDVSAIYNVVQMPPVLKTINIFVGAGVGMHVFSPIFNEQMIRDNINSASEDVDIEDFAADVESKIGLHGLAGIKIKPPVIPLGIKIVAKYYIIPGQAEDTPDSYLNFYGGLSFEI